MLTRAHLDGLSKHELESIANSTAKNLKSLRDDALLIEDVLNTKRGDPKPMAFKIAMPDKEGAWTV